MDEKFLEYLQREVPYWETITNEELQQIRALYQEKEEKYKLWGDTVNRALASKSGVDYSTDVDKTNARYGIALDNLHKFVETLHTKYNYVKPKEDNQAQKR